MFCGGGGGECDNLWAELQDQQRQNQETHQATHKNGKQEVPEIHLEYRFWHLRLRRFGSTERITGYSSVERSGACGSSTFRFADNRTAEGP
jgi:hypothetical protein